MNRTIFSSITLAVAALAAGNAMAADKTVADVQSELAQAQRSGDIFINVSSGELNGKKLNQVYAGQYPAAAAVTGKSRAEVAAELAQAQRSGDIFINVSSGELNGKKLNQVYPAQFAANNQTASGKTREQVAAELAQAQRSGDIVLKVAGSYVKSGELATQTF